jgi:hypothetical protein
MMVTSLSRYKCRKKWKWLKGKGLEIRDQGLGARRKWRVMFRGTEERVFAGENVRTLHVQRSGRAGSRGGGLARGQKVGYKEW